MATYGVIQCLDLPLTVCVKTVRVLEDVSHWYVRAYFEIYRMSLNNTIVKPSNHLNDLKVEDDW